MQVRRWSITEWLRYAAWQEHATSNPGQANCKQGQCTSHAKDSHASAHAKWQPFSVCEILLLLLYPYLQTVVLGANVLAGQWALLPGQFSATSQGPWASLNITSTAPRMGIRGVDRKASIPSGKCKPRETHWAIVKFCSAHHETGLPSQQTCSAHYHCAIGHWASTHDN